MRISKPYHKIFFILLLNRRRKCLAGRGECHPGPQPNLCSLSDLLREKWSEMTALERAFCSVVQASRAQQDHKTILISFPWGRLGYKHD